MSAKSRKTVRLPDRPQPAIDRFRGQHLTLAERTDRHRTWPRPRHRRRHGKPAGVACAPARPRRPRADRAAPVAGRRAAARRIHPRAADAAHDLELGKSDLDRAAAASAQALHRDRHRRASARARTRSTASDPNLPGCCSTSAASSRAWKTSSATAPGRHARPRWCCNWRSTGWPVITAMPGKRAVISHAAVRTWLADDAEFQRAGLKSGRDQRRFRLGADALDHRAQAVGALRR